MSAIKLSSDRTFGVEIEVGHESPNDFQKGLNEISKYYDNFRSVHDGSIKNFALTTEIVSPVLRGQDGLKDLFSVVDILKKHKFKVNETCGLHVHLGADDLSSNTEIIVVPINELWDKYGKEKLEEVYIMPLKNEVVRNTKRLTNLLKDVNFDFGLEDGEYFLHEEKKCKQLEFKRLRCKKVKYITKKSSIPENIIEEVYKIDNDKRKELKILQDFINNARLSREGNLNFYIGGYIDLHDNKDYDSLSTEQNIELKKLKNYFLSGGIHNSFKEYISKLEVENNEVAIIVKERNQTHDSLKLLFGFYLIFNDVLSSFLPKSRRNNHYCKELQTKYSIDEILKINSFDDFDKLWYKSSNGNEIKMLKGNKYHESRYYAINFHSLAKLGTIEIRSHSGTLDKHKIARWILLHQTIFDKVIADKNMQDFLVRVKDIKDLTAKTEIFYDFLSLDKKIETEWRFRADKFNQ